MIRSVAGKVAGSYSAFCSWFEKYLVIATASGFAGGIFIAKFSREFSKYMNAMISNFVDGYDFIAPGIIFIILAPSLSRMFLTRSESSFGGYVLRWFLIRKILACLWAIIFTVIVFRFPLMPERTPSFLHAMQQTLRSLGEMALYSSYFWAVYLSVAVAFMSTKIRFISRALLNTLEGVEVGARYFLPLIPLFMAAIGAYIYALPASLNSQINLGEGMRGALHTISIFGLTLDPDKPMQMVYIYFAGSLLTGIACFQWHAYLIYLAKKISRQFSIKQYITGYWVKIYPQLWATSSESISTPLNLYLTKKNAPWVRESVRRFVIGMGSTMNVNGTLICVYVLGGLVLRLLGVNASIVEFSLTIPVVILISYGVPGIPGELIMFAGPLATLLNLPPNIYPVFLAIYIGIQIGLPDSFRTGNNSTDNYLSAVILDDKYKKQFEGENLETEKDERERKP